MGRVKGLGQIDPLSVRLPHGTEVTTRVDRFFGERRIPDGTVGRVSRTEGDDVDVSIVGVGVVRYARREVLPRRDGQLAFAVRRDAAWTALSPCIVLESTVGSRAWGLSEEGSDIDRRGTFALPLGWTTSLVTPPEDLISDDGSSTYWEVKKTIRQALRADPNTLEMLFVPSATPRDEIGAWILAERDAFLSREMFGTFARYAVAQLRRLEQAARLAEHRGLVLDWLRADPGLDLDGVAVRLAGMSPRAAPTEADRVLLAREWVKQLYRSLHDQGLLPAKDFVSLVEFARGPSRTLELSRELRPKNAYNLLRLILTARDWLESGTSDLVVRGDARTRLLSIKRGEVDLADVLREAEGLLPELEAARDASPLPLRPDFARAEALARRVGQEIARRGVHALDGPFGKDAPIPPSLPETES
ncbi:MAG: UDP-phosphate N-acetylglucosaminyl 1-phosphate transferase [Polyangiaceae bacterium]|nr:UDP-phosphate N-acetylglucosaminyl 1-phosphate transferase [Polyangiaceae bacterium]